jgi:uncharacterized protein (TIGR02145 family)
MSVYGLLYNHYAVIDSRNLAPAGWLAASYSDWLILIDYLGGKEIACIRLIEAGTSHWKYNNSTNESGFTALPGGYRFKWQIISGRGMEYGLLASDGNWWGYDGTTEIYLYGATSYQLSR